MAYDEGLVERVRALMHEHGPTEEKRMFGGLAFLLDGHMAVCASHDAALLVRTDGSESEALLAQDHVEPMQMGAQFSRTWLRVALDGLAADDDLRTWVGRGVATARTQPPKP